MKKRKDGRYVVKVATPDGPKFVYAKTRADVRRKASDLRERVVAGAPVRDDTRRLSDWLNEWQSTCLEISDRAVSTKTMHRGYVRTWIVPVLGEVPIGRLTPNDVARLMLAMKKAGKAESTIRNAYTTLRKALDDAVASGLLRFNPAHAVKQPRVRRKEARFLSAEETCRLLEAASGLRYVSVLKLIVGTGLRRGEACALRWEDVDLERRQARVKGSLVRLDGRLVVQQTKTESSRRTIVLSEAMVALLTTHSAIQAAEQLKAGNCWQASGHVFTTELGKPVEPQNVLRTVRLAARQANLAGVKVHTLRHSYGSVALMAGVPLKVVSTNLGHASITITADTYGHTTDDAARSAAEAVSAAFGF